MCNLCPQLNCNLCPQLNCNLCPRIEPLTLFESRTVSILCSVRPEDRFIILRPGGGVLYLENQTVIKWLDLADAWIFPFLGFFRSGSLAFVARCGGHPVGGGFGLEVDDGAVVGVEDRADGRWWCAWRAGFGQGDGLPEAEALELATDLVGVLDGLVRTHFAAAAGALAVETLRQQSS
jgi:hypothetical protein